MMAYPSPPCPWDEARFPVEVGPKPSPKTLPTWKFRPFTPHPLLYLIPLWVPPARILFPFAQGRIHIMSSCLDLLPNRIHTRRNVEFESRIDECVRNSNKGDDMIETNGNE